jgi:hypothetical protein
VITFLELVMSWSIVITNVASIIVAILAIYGITAWKREFRGRRRMELAEDILTLFYKAEAGLGIMRSPLSSSSEGKSRKQGDDETEMEIQARNRAYVLIERYQLYEDTFNQIQALRFRFMATFGKESIKPFDDLSMIVTKLLLSAKRLAQIWSQYTLKNSSETPHASSLSRQQSEEMLFYENLNETDKLKGEINSFMSEIELTCKEALSKDI